MGKMNLLKSNYIGQVGATYGVEQRHKAFVKAVPFSHAPHNEKQQNALQAFTFLNRLSSGIAKIFFPFLSLSDRKMYRNNAVSQWLKDSIRGGTFALENLSRIIPQDDSLVLKSYSYDSESMFFRLEIENVLENQNPNAEKIYIAAVTNRYVVKWQIQTQGGRYIGTGFFNYLDFAYFRFYAFKSYKRGNKWVQKGLCMSPPIYVIIVAGVFYTMRWPWVAKPYVIDETVFFPSENTYISSGILHLVQSA